MPTRSSRYPVRQICWPELGISWWPLSDLDDESSSIIRVERPWVFRWVFSPQVIAGDPAEPLREDTAVGFAHERGDCPADSGDRGVRERRGPLLTALANAGLSPIAAVRSVKHSSGSPERLLNFEDPATFAPALEDVGSVFLMRPPQISDTKRYLRPFIAAMEQAGVEHAVFLSLMGVNRAMPHWQVEHDLQASSVPWTFLRPSFFSQNLNGAYGADIRDHDRIRLPSGRGRTNFIDTSDIADVAALVLADPVSHVGEAYTLTGPAALDYATVASVLPVALGRPIVYEPIGLLRYRSELRAGHLPGVYVNVQLLINVVARLGLAAKVNDVLPTLLDRPARTLQQFIEDRIDAWRTTSA